MSSTLGPVPIVDFDGTLARLAVDWAALRGRLGVARIDDLWTVDPEGWRAVTDVEVAAADGSEAVAVVTDALRSCAGFAVLTSNAAAAVRRFLEGHPELAAVVVTIVGRDELAGPKTAFDVFERGFRRCVDATAALRGGEPVVYVGDAAYELDFARRLGAHAIDVEELHP